MKEKFSGCLISKARDLKTSFYHSNNFEVKHRNCLKNAGMFRKLGNYTPSQNIIWTHFLWNITFESPNKCCRKCSIDAKSQCFTHCLFRMQFYCNKSSLIEQCYIKNCETKFLGFCLVILGKGPRGL